MDMTRYGRADNKLPLPRSNFNTSTNRMKSLLLNCLGSDLAILPFMKLGNCVSNVQKPQFSQKWAQVIAHTGIDVNMLFHGQLKKLAKNKITRRFSLKGINYVRRIMYNGYSKANVRRKVNTYLIDEYIVLTGNLIWRLC